ncbi:DNA-directed DNA polymerase [Granulicella tundricola MP5ACTX9]|uniref:DNA-directed DNA polymerase n=1 Tax=Granulicella tundricola (strain ATCC BAA-1859 / DSM 23138 / MP5ACTX9) TaxID=1198114 RepID=E8WWP9_GRATM|nr:DNA-directed DNA polymerase [Granulicella tundricola MP5ACTX9]
MPQPDRFGFLHIDLNSFFASVEQQLHPEMRGKPVGVCGTMADTGALIAASYEAKALGIHTLTKVGEAKRICPEIILVNGSHTEYSRFSHEIAAAVERCCPVAHTPSIDEMVCQLMGRECEPPNARRIALEIKQAIKDDVGDTLRCSIGMAPNRYLAKIASDMQKPDGLIGLLPSQLPRAIAHLELRDLPGVGAKTEERLNGKGITTMEQLLALDRTGMHRLWDSVWGDRLYHWLRGGETGDDGAPVASEVQKSLGHSHVMGPEFRSDGGAWSVAHKLLHKASMRLRMEKFYAGAMTVTIKYALTTEQAGRMGAKKHSSGIKSKGWAMEARFKDCQDTLSLLDVLRNVWKQRPRGEEFERPFFVGVTLRELIPEDEHQASLFGDPDNRADLSKTMDKLNLKYGHTTLHFAGMLPARDTAPTRIAFTQIPVQYGVEYM